MFSRERRQIRHDFGVTPELVRRYSKHTPRASALRAARQVTGVTTYLSWMATGEARCYEGSVFGTVIVCMDEVTDELGERLGDGVTERALDGDADHECLEVLSVASDIARGPRFDEAVRYIGNWQDASMKQTEDLHSAEVHDITFHKGGSSALANLHMVKDSPSNREDRFAMQFGYLMQLLDDYRDQPEDDEEGLSTLFTIGDMDAADLRETIADVESQAIDLYGDTPAVRRFFRVCRMHYRLGWMANNTPIDPSSVVPWYL